MKDSLEQTIQEGIHFARDIGLPTMLGFSNLLGLLTIGKFFERDVEADLMFPYHQLTDDKFREIESDPRYWLTVPSMMPKGIIFFKLGSYRVSYLPIYTFDKFAFSNISANAFHVWSKHHFLGNNTITYKGYTYPIPNDPEGFLKSWYGDDWRDYKKRAKGWNWTEAKNYSEVKLS